MSALYRHEWSVFTFSFKIKEPSFLFLRRDEEDRLEILPPFPFLSYIFFYRMPCVIKSVGRFGQSVGHRNFFRVLDKFCECRVGSLGVQVHSFLYATTRKKKLRERQNDELTITHAVYVFVNLQTVYRKILTSANTLIKAISLYSRKHNGVPL